MPKDTDHAAAAEPTRFDAATVPTFLEQRYDRYDAEAHDVWRILYERRMATLQDTGSEVFLRGIERIGLAPDRVPELADVNQRLAPLTGWAAVGVGGFIPAAQFFRCLAQPFEIDHLQNVLFVVDSFDQLFEAVETVRGRRKTGS